MKQCIIVTLVLLLAGASLSCRIGTGSIGSERLRVTLSADGVITLRGRPVPLERLPAKLKSAGAGPQTSIDIAVAASTPQIRMAEITRVLASAGYSRIMFVRPRKTGVGTKAK